jgi:hypothetical protein
MAFTENSPQTNLDVMILPVDGDDASGWKFGTATAFQTTPFDEVDPTFSADGRWLAYVSNESGHQDVYVRPFPGPGSKVQISTDGGVYPTWSRTRPELFYGTADRRIMVVAYRVEGDSFRPARPRPWSDRRYGQRPGQPFDLHLDGNHFVVGPDTEAAAKQDHVTFVFNFFDELRRIAPATTR